MVFHHERLSIPLLAAVTVVALTLGGLLVGYEPVSGDPDCLYRPIKGELARALEQGRLPFWSDQFGLGVPLVAESHAAAFYPPNWLLYRTLNVSAAYRLAMWLHYLALVVAMYGYGRVLGLTPWGGALAGLALALCGFQMSHACHEPFYHLLPYLPLSLMLAERYMAAGGISHLALLALALGAQFTLGHFQIQTWTAGLVLFTGLWRSWADKRPWRRAAGLIVAVGWAGAVAAVQLLLTWDLTKASNFNRPLQFLTTYAFPPAHFAQLAFPSLYMGFVGGGKSPYWAIQRTSADEACLYIGTIPLILAFVGLRAANDRPLAPWRWLAIAGFVLATMHNWFPEGFRLLLHLPILGHFRAPGRYTLLTSVGLCLLAGRGFDRALSRREFWSGYILAAAFGVGAFGWSVYWSRWSDVHRALDEFRAAWFLVAGAWLWIVSLLVVAFWRIGRIPPAPVVLIAACELGYLYHHGTTPWGWAIPFPAQSPVFRALKKEASVGLIGGDLQNLPVRAGMRPAWANLGIVAPPPNYLLEETRLTTDHFDVRSRLRHFGVSHGVYDDSAPRSLADIVFEGEDAILDSLLPGKVTTHLPRTWRIERYYGVFPEVRCARKALLMADWPEMYTLMSATEDPDQALFLEKDRPADPPGPRARNTRIVSWDGHSGEFEHDGTFDLVLRRTFVPGWTARINDGPEIPVVPVDGGLQSVRVPGQGVTRISVRYRPVWLARGAGISLAAVGLAGAVLIVSAQRRRGASSIGSGKKPEASRP